MTDHPAFRVACFFAGLALLGLAGYSLLWTISSSSLAMTVCKDGYSLFADTFRCKQPRLASIAMYASLALAAVVFFVSLRPRGWLDDAGLLREDGA